MHVEGIKGKIAVGSGEDEDDECRWQGWQVKKDERMEKTQIYSN